MKQIGLLGGTAWPSTIEYYRILNEMTQAHYGESHSAKILLWSIDFHEIRQFLPNDWENINFVLKREMLQFSQKGSDCILICNNTLHKSYDLIKNSLNLATPVIHMADLTVQKAKDNGMKHILLLGTRNTMENGYYLSKFESIGIKTHIPSAIERKKIQEVQQHIANEVNPAVYLNVISELLSNYNTIDAVVPACTELPLIITEKTTDLRILDPMKIQCEAAFKYVAI